MMEDLSNLEKIAENNIKISDHEKYLAIELKDTAKQELERAKAREKLAKADLNLAKTKENLSEKTRIYIKDKQEVQKLLKFSESGLKIELDHAKYLELIAEIQIEIAEIHRKISKVEREIAELDFKQVEEKFNLAKERGKLSKAQYKYIDGKRKTLPDEKINSLKEDVRKQEKLLEKINSKIARGRNEIDKEEIKISNLKKQLSEKLSKREKIKPSTENN